MRLTPALSVRKLLSRFQPPFPPQSPRESKHLLNVLESAFQKHLDDVHPSPRVADSKDGGSDVDSIPNPAQRLAHSTHSHLDSILSHPLLKQKSNSLPPPHSLSATAVATFDAALTGKGLDRHIVQFCTLQYIEGLEKKETIAENGKLGPRLANWFTTMDKEEKHVFWTNNKNLKALVAVMYADGLEAEVWMWLRELYDRQYSSKGEASWMRTYSIAEDTLVATMISQTTARGSLSEAAELYVQASKYRRENMPNMRPLKLAGRRLSMAIRSRRKSHGISAGLFDQILGTFQPQHYSGIEHIWLRLYHPKSPSAVELCSKLRSSTYGGLLDWRNKQSSLHHPVHKIFLVNLLDAAQVCLDQNHPADARFVLDVAETEYSEILSPGRETDTRKRLEQAQAAMLIRRFESRRTLQSNVAPAVA
ncbi:hypothetical protein PV08_11526 [Exophiala spinifera]|uniref:Uncharacterized protein n=1 Tax=Exophiala spinifera TaxID=91928 RepID=A0A0D1ZC39_9EURO|nr:uncharacterized protein PV08_11526 [Exophiala spinifera]KIW10562.1 hypothetical protein PV08_11526 [Exophiala spinifera]